MINMKSCLILLLAVTLLLCSVFICAAAEVSGQVVAITGGNDLIIKEKTGKKVNVKIDASNLKIGDVITVRDGVVTRKAGNPESDRPRKIKSFRAH